jgi:hypothetical protein
MLSRRSARDQLDGLFRAKGVDPSTRPPGRSTRAILPPDLAAAPSPGRTIMENTMGELTGREIWMSSRRVLFGHQSGFESFRPFDP